MNNQPISFSKNFEHAITSVEIFVSQKFHVPPDYMYQRNRSRNVVIARYVAFYIFSNIYGLAPVHVGEIFKLDRASVRNGLKKIKASGLDKEIDDQYRAMFPGARIFGSSRVSVDKPVDKLCETPKQPVDKTV